MYQALNGIRTVGWRHLVGVALLWAGLAAPEARAQEGGGTGVGGGVLATEHFRVYFGGSTKGTARLVAEIAEEVYNPIVRAFDYYEDLTTIHIILTDGSDFSNGLANYFENRIVLWATNLDFELRGTHHWIRNVLTHELTHIISLKKARKWPFLVGLVNIEQRNKNPDFSTLLPLMSLSMPSWFSEGIAQYVDDELGYESWDTHRDMLLRMAVLEDDLLGYDEMGYFTKDGIHGEMVYNQGYSLCKYIKETFGPGKVEEINNYNRERSFEGSIKKALEIDGYELYRRWKAHITDHYQGVLSGKIETPVEGRQVIDRGSMDFYPVVSPDGTKLAYLSNQGSDYRLTRLHILDLATGKDKGVDAILNSRPSWSPDGKKLAMTRRRRGFNDLFIYDLEKEEFRRISSRLRAKDPSWSPDGKAIAFVNNWDGTNNIGLMDPDGAKVRLMTNNNDATQYYNPQWSPDGEKLLFGIFRGEDRDIALLDAKAPAYPRSFLSLKKKSFPDSLAFSDSLAFAADSSGFVPLVYSPADERDAVWLPDGNGFLFTTDAGGVFNLCEYSLATGRTRQITNVAGGAFSPSLSPDGHTIYYAGYHAANYSVYGIERESHSDLAVWTPVRERDFWTIYNGDRVGERYYIGRYSRRPSLGFIIPIMEVGPSFIGNEFGLEELRLGLAMEVGDLLASNRLIFQGIVGRNFRQALDLNTDLSIFYEKNFRPVAGETRSFVPRFWFGARRLTINNLRKPRVIRRFQPPPSPFGPNSGLEGRMRVDVVEDTTSAEFESENEYQILGTGVEVSPARGHRVSLNLGLLRFFRTETEDIRATGIDSVFADSSTRANFIQAIPFEITSKGRVYDRLKYYNSKSFAISWSYRRGSRYPRRDERIHPSGGRSLFLQYRRLQSTVSDSLIRDLNRNFPDSTDPNRWIETPADRSGNFETSVNQRVGLNEYTFSWRERLGLPKRTTLGWWTFLGYRDKQVPRSGTVQGQFYWPLRYFLGGEGSLRGYPYFSLRGTKAMLLRGSYTVPLWPVVGRRVVWPVDMVDLPLRWTHLPEPLRRWIIAPGVWVAGLWAASGDPAKPITSSRWLPRLTPFYLLPALAVPVLGNFLEHLYTWNLDAAYLNVYWEGGRTWDFAKLSTRSLTEGGFFGEEHFMQDVGFEARWRFVTAYRFPISAYFGMAWRLRDLKRVDLNDPGVFHTISTDPRRYYFGIRI